MNTPKTSPGNGPNQRTVQGMFIRPRQQVKYAMLFVGGAMLSVVALLGFLVVSFNHALARYNDKFHGTADVGLTIGDSFTISFLIIILIAVLIGILSIYMGIKLSHRIYGPMIPLNRHIEKLIEGDYKSRVRLRKGDELTELSEALNRLATALEERHKLKN